jgi:hypothetical protein
MFSSSWCSIRLFLPCTLGTNAVHIVSAADVARLLPPSTLALQTTTDAALTRLRVFIKRVAHPKERCFVLRNANEGD